MSAVLEAQKPTAKYLSDLQPKLVEHFDLLATAPGGVAKLRELILTFAVRGKLVPQDPRDQPASELMKMARAEHDRLIAEGKVKRGKPPGEVSMAEVPFSLPRGWEWVRLNSLLQKIGAGSTPLGGREVYVLHGVKFLRSQNVWNDGLHLDRVACIKPETHARMAGTTVLANDILFNITGASIGRCAVVPSDFDEANVSQHVTIVRTLIPEFNGFLHKVLISPHVQQAVMDVQVGVSREGLSIAKLGQFLIPLPPLAEQVRIVTRVEELMRLCDALEAKGQLEAVQHAQLMQTLLGALTASTSHEELADNWHRVATHFDLLFDRLEAVDALEQTIVQVAVRGLLVSQYPNDEPANELLKKIRTEKDRLVAEGKVKRDKSLARNTREEVPFALPLGWERVTIDTLASVGSGTTPSRDNSNFFADGSIPWVTSGETGKPFIVQTAQHVTEVALAQTNLTIYPAGTLIVAMYGQGKTRGQVSELQIEATTNQACAAIVLVEPSPTHRSFVKLVFENSYDEMRELSAGGAQPNLNVGKIRSTQIPLPPLAEQSRIVARVERLRRQCASLRQNLTTLQTTQAQLANELINAVA